MRAYSYCRGETRIETGFDGLRLTLTQENLNDLGEGIEIKEGIKLIKMFKKVGRKVFLIHLERGWDHFDRDVLHVYVEIKRDGDNWKFVRLLPGKFEGSRFDPLTLFVAKTISFLIAGAAFYFPLRLSGLKLRRNDL